jgi:hypothetical protein
MAIGIGSGSLLIEALTVTSSLPAGRQACQTSNRFGDVSEADKEGSN